MERLSVAVDIVYGYGTFLSGFELNRFVIDNICMYFTYHVLKLKIVSAACFTYIFGT